MSPSNWMELDESMDGIHTRTLAITPAILKLIAEIDEFKGAWAAIGRVSPKQLTALRRVATIESTGSSTRIEGAKLSDRDIEHLLSGLEIKELSSRDEEEVAGYASVMEMIFESLQLAPERYAADAEGTTGQPPGRLHFLHGSAKDITLTENHIKQLHGALLQYSSQDERHRGNYKTHPNHLEAFGPGREILGVVFETAKPFDTPRLMAGLVDWTNEKMYSSDLHPLIIIAIFVVTFLAIHPFQDGNGRLSRILTSLLLLRTGYDYVPYSSMESVVERSKDAYYLALRRTQVTIRTTDPDWQPWLEFFLRTLQHQKAHLEKKIERERLLLGDLPELSVQILELTRDRGRITVAEAATLTGANRNTIKDHLSALKHAGHLEPHGKGRGTWYGLCLRKTRVNTTGVTHARTGS